MMHISGRSVSFVCIVAPCISVKGKIYDGNHIFGGNMETNSKCAPLYLEIFETCSSIVHSYMYSHRKVEMHNQF